ncbi:MAG TPA: dTMP kinase [Anaerolineae bacterium]|nr:dTMP kinase [Anaerolineae bacterium]
MKGMFISFEGIDGSGKTTQAERLHRRFVAHGHTVHLLREPGGTHVGECIRLILLDKNHTDMSFLTELFLYLAARAQITSHIIVPALEKGDIVIVDRFIDSTTAYQGYARGFDIDEIQHLNFLATSGLVPDMTFVIDCEPSVAFSRVDREPDRLESEGLDFMQKVREGFVKLCEAYPKRMILIDGNRDSDSVEKDISHHIHQRNIYQI